MRIGSLLFLLFLMVCNLSAQDWCKKRKSSHLEKPTGSFDDKLVNDRFNHTITPIILNYRYTQIEVSAILRNEILENGHWVNDPTDYTFNIYNNFSIKHSFSNKTEFQISYTDFLLKGDEAVRDFSNTNMNTGVSVGAKYCIYSSRSKSTRISLFGQLTIPKPLNTFNTIMTPEIRLMLFHPFGKHMNLTYNLGAAYSPVTEKIIALYTINPKIEIGNRVEVFGEFFKNFIKTGPPRTPNKRGLFGMGFYIFENLYIYSSFEAGWYHEESLNSERFDFGMAYRFL